MGLEQVTFAPPLIVVLISYGATLGVPEILVQ
jgi:hypothetical protein